MGLQMIAVVGCKLYLGMPIRAVRIIRPMTFFDFVCLISLRMLMLMFDLVVVPDSLLQQHVEAIYTAVQDFWEA